MLLWSTQSPDLREHRTTRFSLFPRFSSTRPCLQNSPSCVSEHTGSSSLFSTTTSQLTETTDLPFQLVTPLHLPSAVGQKVSLLRSLPLLLARTSMAAGQPERTAETREATRGADQRLALCPCSDASWGRLKRGNATKAKENTISAKRRVPGNADAVTCCVKKLNLTIRINLGVTIANVGRKDISPRKLI